MICETTTVKRSINNPLLPDLLIVDQDSVNTSLDWFSQLIRYANLVAGQSSAPEKNEPVATPVPAVAGYTPLDTILS